jgi:hypothetical protein
MSSSRASANISSSVTRDYGVLIEAWPIAINNAITLVLAASVLVMKWRFERTMP